MLLLRNGTALFFHIQSGYSRYSNTYTKTPSEGSNAPELLTAGSMSLEIDFIYSSVISDENKVKKNRNPVMMINYPCKGF